MNDAPRAEELLRAVERFLERDVVPALAGVTRFHARVAANVVAMVAREIETEEAHLAAEWAGLDALLGAAPRPAQREALRTELGHRNQALIARIRAGEMDAGPQRAALLAHLRRTTAARMAVSRPPRQRDG